MHCFRKTLQSTPVINNVARRGAIQKYNCLIQASILKSRTLCSVNEVTSNISGENASETTPLKGGFAKAFEKHSNITQPNEESQTFSTLLRNSKLMDLGDPCGKIVIGKIFHIVEDDLYIDFGWKFHCVCTRPTNRGNEYVRGARVRIQINELELSSRFLGSSTDLTLLEADCKLLGIVSTPVRPALDEK